jgi:uncharacterized protein (TIGR00251 family)
MLTRIWVTVKPHARIDSLTRVADGEYQVSVHAPPEDGKANQAVMELLARHFRVPKSAIKIVRGHASRKKLISID